MITTLNADERKTFGDRLMLMREKMGKTQSEMGELLGCARTTINNYENGKSAPTLLTVGAIALLLHTTPDYLLGHKNDPAPKVILFQRGHLDADDLATLRLYEKLKPDDRMTINHLIKRLYGSNSGT